MAATILGMYLTQERRAEPSTPWVSVLVGVGLVLAAVVQTAIALVIVWFIAFGTQGTCYDPASSDDLRQARIDLAVLAALSAGPWLLAASLAHKRRAKVWLLLEAVVVTLVPGYFLIFVLAASPSEWTSGFCF